MKNKISYTAAFEELQAIVSDLEDGEIGVDELSEKVQRAAELIRICKEKLQHTETDVKKILSDLEDQTDNPEGSATT